MNFAESFNFPNCNFLHHRSTVMAFVPAARKGDSTYSFGFFFHWRGFSPSRSSWARRVTAPTPSSWGSGGPALEERGEDCNLRLDHLVSPLKKITKRKKNSSNLTSKIRFFLHFWCTSSFHWRGFSPSLSSWARRVTALCTYSFGLGEWGAAALEERGEDCNSRLDHLVSPLKKYKTKKSQLQSHCQNAKFFKL